MGKGYVVAVVGSGGKTTLIEYLSNQSKSLGKKAAVMTTTHMRLPQMYDGVGKSVEEAISIMKQEGIVYYGNFSEEREKMTFPGNQPYEELCQNADMVFVEADGSRMLPMKVPNWPREPVIPIHTEAIIVVLGLTALGRPLKETCQRWELGREWISKDLGSADHAQQDDIETLPVTKEIAVEFLIRGYLKPLRSQFPHRPLITLLNQADSLKRREAGKQMKEMLEQKGWECRVTRLKTIKISVIYLASGFGNRFGRNKLLEPFEGKRLFEHGLELFFRLKRELEAEEGILADVIVVSQYPEILEAGHKMGMETVVNPDAAEGISASIRLGTMAAPEDTDYYLYSVADQPWLKEETIKAFLNRFLTCALSGQASIGCLSFQGKGGNPAIFHQKYGEELRSLKGDKGGSQIMKRYPGEVLKYQAEEKELKDIDCREDLPRR